VYVGYQAGTVIFGTGNYNTVIGSQAGLATTSPSNNTLVGYMAGSTLTTGGGNTIIGASADTGSNAIANSVVIGNGAVASKSNQCVLGSMAADLQVVESGTGHIYFGSVGSVTATTTLTWQMIKGGIIDCNPAAGQTYTFDTAVNIRDNVFGTSGTTGCEAGSTVYVLISNRSANNATIALPGAGFNNRLCSGTLSANSSRYLAVFLAASGTPTINVYG